jgi:hypothetical protein
VSNLYYRLFSRERGMIFGMSLRAVEPQDEGDLIQQGDCQQGKLNAAVAGKHCDETDDQA